jgi:hypothetical protein
MRFSDMMGSGAEREPKPTASESEAVVAEASAPYLDAAPRDSVHAAEPAVTAAPLVGASAAARVSTPTEPVAVRVVVDLPLSDDLLPRRR